MELTDLHQRTAFAFEEVYKVPSSFEEYGRVDRRVVS